jgi:hypothetical protein
LRTGVAGVTGVQEALKERKGVVAFMTYANNAVTKNFSASGLLHRGNPVLQRCSSTPATPELLNS